MPTSVGTYYYYGEDGYEYGLANISVNFTGGKPVSDITPYLNALPPELSSLKESIIASYESSGSGMLGAAL